MDEWEFLQAYGEVSELDTTQQIDYCWNCVSAQVVGHNQYQSLTPVIISGLVLAQTNDECERSLSINARVVTSDRSAIGEASITGLRTVKEAARFYDPVNGQPENIAITKELQSNQVKRTPVDYINESIM